MKIKFKTAYLLILAVFMVMGLASCSNDDDEEETIIYHQSYMQGTLNNTAISMNDINAAILANKSYYEFKIVGANKTASVMDWEAKLLETSDSVVTLFLHIDGLERTNDMIYSPNNGEPIQSKNTCYITVKHRKTGVTTTYHPTNKSPISVRWNAFRVTADMKVEKHKGVTWEYSGYEWPGIVGKLNGVFMNDDVPSKAITLELDFKLY